MAYQMDMATALELTLESDQEAKFQALKILQSKKIKHLMRSIDAKDKELAKLKVLGKDNRRTQMIQLLRNKLRDQELVTDVIKEELSSKGDMTTEEVNSYIIRKTLGGPKRFRPLTREELENKINDLEKKAKKNGNGLDCNSRSVATLPTQGQGGQANSITNANTNNNRNSNNNNNNDNDMNRNDNSNTNSPDLSTMARLADDLSSIRIILNSKDATINQQNDDIHRLRARNAELRVADEELDFQDRKYHELEKAYDKISEDYNEKSQKNSQYTEENTLLKSEISNESELYQSELQGLRDQSEKFLKQNLSLLKNMATLEDTLEKALYDLTSMGNVNAIVNADGAAKTASVIALETKLTRITEKLKSNEEKCSELIIENKQIDILKDNLREKNNLIKGLTRNLESKNKSENMNNSNSTNLLNDKSNDELRKKVVDYMEENKNLKKALAAATMTNSMTNSGSKLFNIDKIGK